MNRIVAFVGSCQVSGMGTAARQLLPDSRVSSFHVGAGLASDQIVTQIADADVVITGIRDTSAHGASFGPTALARPGRTVLFLPTFVFTGFHPDMIHLAINRRTQQGPVGRFHSTIAAAAFVAGVPKREAPNLYNAHVFARLGYLDAFASARAAAIEAFAREGYDLRPAFTAWSATDRPFMYTINHPATPVLSTLATLALQRAGLIDGTVESPAIHDMLASATNWPTFPAIARRTGVIGSTTFLRSVVTGPESTEREVPLTDYVEQSYAISRKLGPDALTAPRIRTAVTALQSALGAARYPVPDRSLASPASM